MKRILLILIGILVLHSCKEHHVYHTYYKAIDIDTIQGIPDSDGEMYYPIMYTPMNSSIADAMGLEHVFNVIFYKPSKDLYSTTVFGSDGGNSARIYFNPFTGATDSIK